jgi:murein DD-endopeptidase MepM/ murein hydrolase activator NlpD
MKILIKICIVGLGLFSAITGFADSSTISIKPGLIRQGDPLIITINNLDASTTVNSLFFNNTQVPIFTYLSTTTALVGIDLNRKPGTSTVTATLSDGQIIKQDIYIDSRLKKFEYIDIPSKLGGNTIASQNQLLSSLAIENAILASLRTGTKAFWSEPFIFPVANPVVTDPYGYSRVNGITSIAHKGTDFRAPIGTPVKSMNRGVVRLAQNFRNYGKTIVVDHGLGVMTLYIHLSKIYVGPGELVQKGDLIGLSGDTGYAEHPHLHLSVKINTVSIDPMVFMDIVGEKNDILK